MVIKAQLDNRVDITVQDHLDRTALHVETAFNKNPMVITALPNAGANISLRKKPFDLVQNNAHKEAAQTHPVYQ